ncbi:hypothetical protein [Streptomyces pratensis]|uniref:hypothetical protein n=1 Tax=Streptomyces pratensis TaxID=1169025 RepID=UPI00363BA72D
MAIRTNTAGSASFPRSGRAPARQLLARPRCDTWIELPCTLSRDAALRLAADLLSAGMPPGALMTGDSWAPDCGTGQFDRAGFPDPTAMIRQLYDRGFSDMSWIVPFADARPVDGGSRQ